MVREGDSGGTAVRLLADVSVRPRLSAPPSSSLATVPCTPEPRHGRALAWPSRLASHHFFPARPFSSGRVRVRFGFSFRFEIDILFFVLDPRSRSFCCFRSESGSFPISIYTLDRLLIPMLDSVDRLGVDQSGKQLSAGENTLLMSSVTSTSHRRRGTQGWRTRGTEAA